MTFQEISKYFPGSNKLLCGANASRQQVTSGAHEWESKFIANHFNQGSDSSNACFSYVKKQLFCYQ